MPERPDCRVDEAPRFPWVLVDLDGHAIDRYPTKALAESYRGEAPAGSAVLHDPEPRELSRRLDLP